MSNLQCRKLSTDVIKGEASFLIINGTIQNRSNVSIRTASCMPKTAWGRCFSFIHSYIEIRRRVKSDFNVVMKGGPTPTSHSLLLPAVFTTVLKSCIVFSFGLCFIVILRVFVLPQDQTSELETSCCRCNA